jgi:UDP-glucose 4-epimerase
MERLKVEKRRSEGNRRPGDIASAYADASKAKNELGWTAKRGIVEMCRDSWRFEKNYRK